MQTKIVLAGCHPKSGHLGIRYTKDLCCDWVSINDIAFVPKTLTSLRAFFELALTLDEEDSLKLKTKFGQWVKIYPNNGYYKGKTPTYIVEFKLSKTTVPRDHLMDACEKLKELINESKSKKVR